jgi:hypothetical protein
VSGLENLGAVAELMDVLRASPRQVQAVRVAAARG